MDLIKDLGALALGSRLKRLSDELMQDGIRIYKESPVDFQPKWFPVYTYLLNIGPRPVMDIARGLKITHPSVNQIAKEMIQAGYVAAYKDRKDKRKRVLALTSYGKKQESELRKVWRDVEGALQTLLDETQVDFLGYLDTLERSLVQKSFIDRFRERASPESDNLEVISFDAAYAADFKRINESWILEYFEIEPADAAALDHPQKYVIDPGGDILFVLNRETEQVLGTCALINRDGGRVELAKMGVDRLARGLGVGKYLAFAAVRRAREMGFQQMYLETSTRLAPALGLYRQMGFVRQPMPEASDYQRADVYMTMAL